MQVVSALPTKATQVVFVLPVHAWHAGQSALSVEGVHGAPTHSFAVVSQV